MARKVPFAKLKFEDRLMQEINILLRRDFADPRLTMVSVTGVELSNDYAYATVSWDTFDKSKRGDAKAALEGLTSKLRSKLSQILEVRHTPALNFVYNAQFEEEHNIDLILKKEKARTTNPSNDDESEDGDEE